VSLSVIFYDIPDQTAAENIYMDIIQKWENDRKFVALPKE